MYKKVLFISASLRPSSNSEALAREVEKGVIAGGHLTEFITLKDLRVGYCRGCLSCQKTHECVIDDDMRGIAEKIRDADTLVFATPLYFYGMSGQLKTLLDRTNPLYSSDYRFREVFLVVTSEDDAENCEKNVIEGIRGWTDCFPESRFAGAFSGRGIGTGILGEDILNDAFLFGKEI